MKLPWRREGPSDRERLKREQVTEDVRIQVGALVEELKRALDRAEAIAEQMEDEGDGTV